MTDLRSSVTLGPAAGCLCAAAVVAALSASSCKKASLSEPDVDLDLVEILGEKINLRHDKVGLGEWETETTFALVDARNNHSVDLDVSVGGEFVDDDGKVVAVMRAEALRIPAGGVRTFAMVDQAEKPRPTATQVSVRVLGASPVRYPPNVTITDEYTYEDNNSVVLKAHVNNQPERRVKAIILATFYDINGVPMKRFFTPFELGGKLRKMAQFVGPPGSVSGYIFVGQTVY